MQTAVGGIQHDAVPDTRMLGKAVDYFASGKYHEALTLFVKLDKKYKLNPRFMAYIGICYYHEQEYTQACRYLDTSIPSLSIYAPAERGIYYHAAAEIIGRAGNRLRRPRGDKFAVYGRILIRIDRKHV